MASGGCIDNLVRKYWAVDYCGNASDTIEQIIMIIDEMPPTFTDFPEDQNIEWTAGLSIPSVAQLEAQIDYTGRLYLR